MLLRQLTESDYKQVKEWLSERELFDLVSISEYDADKPSIRLAVVQNHQLIGVVEVFNIQGDAAEIGIAIPQKKGVGFYAAARLIYMLETSGFKKIIANIRIDNRAAIRCALAMGFKIKTEITGDVPYFNMIRGD